MQTISVLFLVAAATLIAVGFGTGGGLLKRPLVGCIRWDGCWYGSPYAKALGPAQWRHMLPFYAQVASDGAVEIRGDTQEVMDREISYASEAGLDYWAFCHYHPSSGAARYDYGRELYLTSTLKDRLRFCLILMPDKGLGTAEEWPATVQELIALLKEPTYQKVLGDRPLVFFFTAEAVEQLFGSPEKAREGLGYLRRQAAKAGAGDPYLVSLVWTAQAGAECVNKYGFDAMSSYAPIGSGDGSAIRPYRALTEANREFWEACKATGKRLIPTVNTGWDNRPLQGEQWKDLYPQGPNPLYEQPVPEEFAAHLRSAIEWSRQNAPSVEANTVLIYAWNETGEGGRLVPSLEEGAARLEAMGKVLREAETRE